MWFRDGRLVLSIYADYNSKMVRRFELQMQFLGQSAV